MGCCDDLRERVEALEGRFTKLYERLQFATFEPDFPCKHTPSQPPELRKKRSGPKLKPGHPCHHGLDCKKTGINCGPA